VLTLRQKARTTRRARVIARLERQVERFLHRSPECGLRWSKISERHGQDEHRRGSLGYARDRLFDSAPPSAASRDKSVRRSAQDDDFVGVLTKNIPNKLALMGLRQFSKGEPGAPVPFLRRCCQTLSIAIPQRHTRMVWAPKHQQRRTRKHAGASHSPLSFDPRL
jgi:hypothetical protein